MLFNDSIILMPKWRSLSFPNVSLQFMVLQLDLKNSVGINILKCLKLKKELGEKYSQTRIFRRNLT